MSQKQKIVHSFFWKLLERFGSQAISMFVTILLARILLPSEYGIIAILVVFIDLANVIIDGGLNTALIQNPAWVVHRHQSANHETDYHQSLLA